MQKSDKVWIVYLFRTNDTKFVAQTIQSMVGGDLAAFELITPYPENYQIIVDQVTRENETGYLPPLKTRIEDIQGYDIIFVGFPTWGMKLPPPMKSFLHQYDLSGKKVIPVNTNAAYGVGSSIETIGQLCPRSDVSEAYFTKDDKEKQVREDVKK